MTTREPALWAEVLYGRTLQVDEWWQAVPEDADRDRLDRVIDAVLGGGRGLSDGPRYVLARDDAVHVVGLACRASLLSGDMATDSHRRPLYCFVGWYRPASSAPAPSPLLPDLEANATVWAAPVYERWMASVWTTDQSALHEPPTAPYTPPPWAAEMSVRPESVDPPEPQGSEAPASEPIDSGPASDRGGHDRDAVAGPPRTLAPAVRPHRSDQRADVWVAVDARGGLVTVGWAEVRGGLTAAATDVCADDVGPETPASIPVRVDPPPASRPFRDTDDRPPPHPGQASSDVVRPNPQPHTKKRRIGRKPSPVTERPGATEDDDRRFLHPSRLVEGVVDGVGAAADEILGVLRGHGRGESTTPSRPPASPPPPLSMHERLLAGDRRVVRRGEDRATDANDDDFDEFESPP